MCIFIRLFVFTLIFAVGLPAVAYAEVKLPPGFIAVSDTRMNWYDAKAFCEQQGGRLPRINGTDSWDGKGEATIDGFGVMGAPWPSGLPNGIHWTGTEVTDGPGNSWHVGDRVARGGHVGGSYDCKSIPRRVVCVPK